MTETEEFKKEFQKISFQKSQIQSNSKHLKTLHAWDRGGSHDKAILKCLAKRDVLKEKFNELLKGLEYEDWRKFSEKLTRLNQRLKRSEETWTIIGLELEEHLKDRPGIKKSKNWSCRGCGTQFDPSNGIEIMAKHSCPELKKITEQIGCGYCVHEESCTIRVPSINKAKLGCPDWKHHEEK